MNDERSTEDFEAVAAWFRAESPEVSGLEMDRVKQRAVAQAGRRSESRLPARIAGGLLTTKGLFMDKRPRPLMTVFLVLGLVAVFSVPAIYATGQLPTLGGFDAAQTQYDDDDDGGNPGGGNGKSDDDDDGGSSSKDDDDDDGGSEEAGVAPVAPRTCASAPFRTPAGLQACNRAATLAASGGLTPAQACAGFPVTLGRRAACLAAAGPAPTTP